jgi:protein-tyrosine phosphatase
MLFDQWTGAKGIPDPYQQSEEFQEKTYRTIEAASAAWKSRLSTTGATQQRS